MKQTVKTFRALGDPTRLRIFKLLEGGELCVCQLMATLKMGQSRISRHLSVLKEAELIEDRRQGKWVHYRLKSQKELKNLLSVLKPLDAEITVKKDRTHIVAVAACQTEHK
jgi:ArsR family transcriptional regulator